MQAIVYSRFSDRPDAAESESIATQETRCKAYVQSRGWSLITAFSDAAMSGARADNRPGLQDALIGVKEHKAALVVYNLSRLTRSVKDAITIAEQLRAAGAQLVSINESIDTSTPLGSFFFTMTAALAELERKQIGARTSDGMQRRQASGQLMTRPDRVPYGWKIVDPGTMEPEPKEQFYLARLHQYIVTYGPGKFDSMAAFMNSDGLEYRGRRWRARDVERALRREVAK